MINAQDAREILPMLEQAEIEFELKGFRFNPGEPRYTMYLKVTKIADYDEITRMLNVLGWNAHSSEGGLVLDNPRRSVLSSSPGQGAGSEGSQSDPPGPLKPAEPTVE